MVDSNILEVHVCGDESGDVNDLTIQWEAHGAVIKNSIAVADVLVSIVVVMDHKSTALLVPVSFSLVSHVLVSLSLVIFSVLVNVVVVVPILLVHILLVAVQVVSLLLMSVIFFRAGA